MRPFLAWGALAVLAWGAVGCGAPRPRGVVLVTLDTTRADHLGCYGDRNASTPNLDAFAREGVRFGHAESAVPVTFPSHATVFTGLYPPRHGVRYNGMFTLADSATTLAEVLHGAGWQTAAVPSSYPVAKTTGLGQGFDVYMDIFDVKPGETPPPATAERKADDVTRLGLDWLAKRDPAKPFFLWLHYFDAHWPYAPPFPYSAQFRDRPYDGEIAFVDASVGKFLDGLAKDGLAASTLVVVFGDHGEGLYDHGEKMHANLVYESTLHVPLLVRGPGVARDDVVGDVVSLVDVGPTILDAVGLRYPTAVDGVSLLPALRGGAAPHRDIYFESFAGSLVYGWSPLEGVRRGRYKLIDSSDPELYDLDTDPGEKVNLIATDAGIADDLHAELTSWTKRWASEGTASKAVATPLDSEALARLASLGYVGGTVTDELRGGPSPRKFVHLDTTFWAAQDAMKAKDFPEVLDRCATILREDPGNRFALNLAGYAAVRLGRIDDALRYGKDLLARYPDFVPASLLVGEIAVRRKEWAHAVDVFSAGVAKNPKDTALRFHLALALLGDGRAADAVREADAGLALPDAPPAFHVTKAAALLDSGDAAGALAEVGKAARAGFHDVDALDGEPLMARLRALPGVRDALAPSAGGR